ncbi:uncharacterized protein LOC105841611 [Bombyx mori]|uniref:THAP-type domain-containing protein n=1 Tax=Bombyx mori TaxID=7091 RepID=A0A8R2M6Q5_BOMMO|nr:uncharacterized protein LOC105841611 [Bombyx mori]
MNTKMPYYCTVPRCTSMAGKAKNVSFHQFPRDEELAKLWNNILKRGKPYTKYSKVCSLHFKPEDYTLTSVGKNKGQWRTLRKDAIPSRNLPSDSPLPYQRRQSDSWLPVTNSPLDPQVQQQMAQAIYIQTMLAMQAVTNDAPSPNNEETTSSEDSYQQEKNDSAMPTFVNDETKTSYKCKVCTKCFKDPDVMLLHQRTHNNSINEPNSMTMQANPILAGLLRNNSETANGNLFAALALNLVVQNLFEGKKTCEELKGISAKYVVDET